MSSFAEYLFRMTDPTMNPNKWPFMGEEWRKQQFAKDQDKVKSIISWLVDHIDDQSVPSFSEQANTVFSMMDCITQVQDRCPFRWQGINYVLVKCDSSFALKRWPKQIALQSV